MLPLLDSSLLEPRTVLLRRVDSELLDGEGLGVSSCMNSKRHFVKTGVKIGRNVLRGSQFGGAEPCETLRDSVSRFSDFS